MGRGVGDREGPKMAVSAEGALGVVGQGALCWAPSILVSPAPPVICGAELLCLCVVFLCK